MNEIILHHYPASPFSEKIRLVLGYKKLAWKSVIIPSIMPKPDVIALTGGYRRTPFMQIGADIYCDTALICEQLEILQPEPTLYPAAVDGNAHILAQWADSTLFWSAMAYNLGPKGVTQAFANLPPEARLAFAEDRAKMSGNMTRLRPADAAAAYKIYLRRLEAMLQQSAFFLGSVPTIADFAVYHSLWFTRVCVPVLADVFQVTPRLLKWMDRMADYGHGEYEKFDAAEAIALAANSTPQALASTTFQDEHGIPLGARVSITAESFGAETTQGELLCASATHYTLRRHDERAGTVHVHFPRAGYVLKVAQ